MIDAVIFDLDGTITVPVPDFRAIRGEIGVPDGTDILSHIETLSDAGQEKAHEILDRYEDETARTNRLNVGARELLDFLREEGVTTAVVTRNSRRSFSLCCERHGLSFGSAVTREEAPPKPDPASVLMLAAELGFDPAKSIVVGDYLFDIQLGEAVGATTVRVKSDGVPRFTANPDFEVASLAEIIPIVKELGGSTV